MLRLARSMPMLDALTKASPTPKPTPILKPFRRLSDSFKLDLLFYPVALYS